MTDRPTAAAAPVGRLDPAAVTRLRVVIARLYRQLAQASGRQDLTLTQLSALAKIEEHGPLRVGDLAAREMVAGPSMIRTVNPLVDAGLVDRRSDPSDGRSCLVSLTPAGRSLFARIRRDRSELLSRRVERLSPEQCDLLQAALPVLELLLTEEDS